MLRVPIATVVPVIEKACVLVRGYSRLKTARPLNASPPKSTIVIQKS